MAEEWHQMTGSQVADELAVDPTTGLTASESRSRLEQVGPNELQAAERSRWWHMLMAQFKDFMVLVLLGATAISYALGEHADAITIVAIVVVNAILGFVQEFRAERSLEALRQLAAPTARARRDGHETQVPAAELVPGDVVLLEAGDRIPADGRLLEAASLEVEEAALTGESLPVRKRPDWTGPAATGIGDRKNMVFVGTTVTRGRGAALIVATGMETEMGRIAGMMQAVEEEDTPLQKRLESLGRWLVLACLAVCGIVVATGVMRGEPVTQMFLTGVSLAVAAIPEGLPAIVTVALALGVQRMIRRNAIVRKLQAVETLGCATVICSDKTGTLTKNEMMVRAAWVADGAWQVTGDGYAPEGDFLRADAKAAPAPLLRDMLLAAALCSNAALVQTEPEQRSLLGARRKAVWGIQGDPTEGALVVAAAKANCDTAPYERLVEAPFESERRRMSVVVRHRTSGAVAVHVKGAPDVIVGLCSHIMRGGRMEPMRAELLKEITAQNDTMASGALRVIAIATRPVTAGTVHLATAADAPAEALAEALEKDLVFLGLVGMIDPPRPEVKDAVKAAKRAGMSTVMITGDHPVHRPGGSHGAGHRPVADEAALTGADWTT